MHEHLEHEQEHIYATITNARDKQDEIAEVFYDSLEHKRNRILKSLTTLAKYYYGTDKVINYSAYTENIDPQDEDLKVKNLEYLYTLIQYEGKDILLHIGTGEFTPEVFIRRNIPQLAWLSHSALPLFVVTARAKKEYEREKKERMHGENIVTKFLNEHAIIYAPKGGQAESRNISQSDCPDINHGMSNGIVKYDKVIEVLQDAIIQRAEKEVDSDLVDRAKIIGEIASLQSFSKDKFVGLTKTNIKNQSDTQKYIFRMLKDMVEKIFEKYNKEINEKNEQDRLGEKMYEVLKLFDVKKLSAK